MIDSDSITFSALDDLIKESQLMDLPYVRIIEQPAPRSFRFRYKCEYDDRSGCIGSIIGINTTFDTRTFPKIQVMNYQGSYAVVVSCVTKDGPLYRPHPYKIVENLKKEVYNKVKKEELRGIYYKIVNNSTMTCSFPNLGILSVKIKDIKKSLELRKKLKVDPFGTGFDYTKDIDLNILRLCFQVFLKDSEDKHTIQIPPVVSEPIYDKKSISDLTIMKFSHYSAPATGGTEVILLCDRVPKESIEIWFYEEYDSNIIWESPAEFHPSDVHKQVAISFRIPRYRNEKLQQPASVYVELRDKNRKGKPRPFQYLPMERDPDGIARKRQKVKECIDLESLFQGNIVNGGPIPRERQVAIGIPRTSGPSTSARGANAKTSLVSGASCSTDAFARVPTHFASECSGASVFPSVPVGLSSTPQQEQAYLPYISTSPNDHNYSSATPSSESMIPAIMHQMIPISKPVSSSVKDQMLTIFEPIHSPIVYQMEPASESSDRENVQLNIDDAIIEKFDSFGLDSLDIDLAQAFSPSMFQNNLNFTEHQHNY